MEKLDLVSIPCAHLGRPIFTKVPPSLATPKQLSTFQQTCQAEGLPPPKINWNRLGKPLPVAKTEVKEGNLTIRNLSPADSGLYECVASNSMGTKKATMNMIVQQLGLYLLSIIKKRRLCSWSVAVTAKNRSNINWPQKLFSCLFCISFFHLLCLNTIATVLSSGLPCAPQGLLLYLF